MSSAPPPAPLAPRVVRDLHAVGAELEAQAGLAVEPGEEPVAERVEQVPDQAQPAEHRRDGAVGRGRGDDERADLPLELACPGAAVRRRAQPLERFQAEAVVDQTGIFLPSSTNFLRPTSVSGCFTSCCSTLHGTVHTSAPSSAAFTTCVGLRTDATSTSVSKS